VRLTLDTNILVYAYDRSAGQRHEQAMELVERALEADCVLTVQALAELFHVLVRRKAVPTDTATAIVHGLRDAFPLVAADEGCLVDAMDAVVSHSWSFWDAMIWATAKHAGCRLLLSEDGQHERSLGGVTVVNPFAPERSPQLTAALGFSH
jgi:predicted nucleic acid-binding protein